MATTRTSASKKARAPRTPAPIVPSGRKIGEGRGSLKARSEYFLKRRGGSTT